MKQIKEWFGELPLAILTAGMSIVLLPGYIRTVFSGKNALSESGGPMGSPREKHWSDGICEAVEVMERTGNSEEIIFV